LKRLFFVLMALIMLMSLTCCSLNSDNAEDNKKQLIKVGFSQTGAESVWRVADTESIKSALSEENGFDLIYDDGQQKQENQIRAIRNFIQQDVDYIVLAPLVENGWDSVLEEAKQAGIPVIVVDRMVNVKDSSLYTAYIGTNFLQEGETAVNWLESALKKYGREDDNINIVDIQGTMNSTAQIGRSEALAAAIKKHPNWKLAAQECGEFTKPKSYEVMSEILTKTKDIDVCYCENDSEAFGAIKALQEAGLTCNINGGVIVISFDATSEGLTDCLSGLISMDVECNPLQGPYVARIISQLNSGNSVHKITYLDETWFDCFNITQGIIDNRAY
jgi:galactofuranose transport system substrate-binding protein